MNEECRAWAERRGAPTLLVETSPSEGLTDEHVEQLLRLGGERQGRASLRSRREFPLRAGIVAPRDREEATRGSSAPWAAARRRCGGVRRGRPSRPRAWRNGAHAQRRAQCAAAVDGRWAWQWRQLGTPRGRAAARRSRAARGGGRPQAFSCRPAGLQPDTSYQYRLLVDPGQPCDLQRAGHLPRRLPRRLDGHRERHALRHASRPSRSATTCRAPAESLAAFVASNPAGSQADRRVLCMRPGTQEIGQLNGLKAWTHAHAARRGQRHQAAGRPQRQHRARRAPAPRSRTSGSSAATARRGCARAARQDGRRARHDVRSATSTSRRRAAATAT